MPTRITIDDTATLPTLATMQQTLVTAFASAASVLLDISRVTRADAGFVQLVEAARVHAADTGASFSLSAPAPAPVEALLRRAGFLNDPAASDTGFWLHGAAR